MGKIQVLSKQTIDQIAAGEVVERPSSVVKELVENAIDAGATAISVETNNGGIDYIRVTDNGSGITPDDIPTAFKAHATSKIREIEDLDTVMSLGFRGEALSSIASVAKVTLITKTKEEYVGTCYKIAGGEVGEQSEIGAPDGTTMLVEDLFYNTPARRKFLKTPMTESAYVGDLLEKFALSKPDIRFKWTANGSIRLSTGGNGKTKDLIYQIFGRETANESVEVFYDKDGIRVTGFIGKPIICKGNRGFENYFINGRFVKSKVIDRAIEDAFAPFMMQHRYPFCVLYLELSPSEYDVNVHPTKMELRFLKETKVYDAVKEAVSEGLKEKELIPDVALTPEKEEKETVYEAPEPFEVKRIEEPGPSGSTAKEAVLRKLRSTLSDREDEDPTIPLETAEKTSETPEPEKAPEKPAEKPEQMTFDKEFMGSAAKKEYRLIGQLFKTYWLIEIKDSLYILDQHAAHEKVLFERFMKRFSEKTITTEYISPPVILTVTEQEELVLNRFADVFVEMGFEISFFGQKEYAISGIPGDVCTKDIKGLFTEMLSGLIDEYAALRKETVYNKIASMSCKAAVKGNQLLSPMEADALISELLTLNNPYACPHGRPTLISISKTELEKKFKRIV